MENNNYASRFGNTNLLTDEEKSSYREFAQKVHKMSHKDIFLLNSNMRDTLTTEQQDIVAWELKLRELEIYKKKNIKPEESFDTLNVTGNVPLDYDLPYAELQNRVNAEKKAMIGMDDKLLERSKKILEEHPVVISANNLHNLRGGGVNMLAKSYIVEDDNGKRISVDNQKIQEHYRKMYIKRMSEVTGIDYTQYDLTPDEENMDYLDPPTNTDNHKPTNTQEDEYIGMEVSSNINLNDYEDDD